MNKKNVALIIGGMALYVGYKLYKIMELADSIVYKPKGISFKRGGKGVNSFAIVVNMELYNPTGTTLQMRGVDGTLSIGGQVVSVFSSGAFVIRAGTNNFPITFQIDSLAIVATLVSAITSKKPIRLDVELKKKIPFITQTENFSFGTGDLPQDTTSIAFK
jgi:LEA14-like dessication related protein